MLIAMSRNWKEKIASGMIVSQMGYSFLSVCIGEHLILTVILVWRLHLKAYGIPVALFLCLLFRRICTHTNTLAQAKRFLASKLYAQYTAHANHVFHWLACLSPHVRLPSLIDDFEFRESAQWLSHSHPCMHRSSVCRILNHR